MLGDDSVGCLAVQHALAPGIVGGVEAAQKLFELAVRVDGSAEHFRADAAVEALDQTVGLRPLGASVTILCAETLAGLGEGRGGAAAIVGQHMGEPEGKGGCGLAQEGDGALFGFVVLDGEVDGARVAVDGHEQVSLAPFAVAGLQLGQVLVPLGRTQGPA